MRDSRGEIKSPRTMPCPGLPLLRSVKGHHKLSGGMDGVCEETDRGPVKAVPSGEKGVYGRRAKMVEGELGGGKKIGPAIRGKGNMTGRQDRNEVVFSGSYGPFRAVSAVVLGGHILNLDFRLRRAKESGKVS